MNAIILKSHKKGDDVLTTEEKYLNWSESVSRSGVNDWFKRATKTNGRTHKKNVKHLPQLMQTVISPNLLQ